MYTPILLALLIFVLGLSLGSASASGVGIDRSVYPKKREPIRVIFDTDMWSDIDDVLALAMLHALHDRHEIKLLAVTISTDEAWCAVYVDLVNTFYGHSQIPVGLARSGMNLQSFRKRFPEVPWPVTRYTELISER